MTVLIGLACLLQKLHKCMGAPPCVKFNTVVPQHHLNVAIVCSICCMSISICTLRIWYNLGQLYFLFLCTIGIRMVGWLDQSRFLRLVPALARLEWAEIVELHVPRGCLMPIVRYWCTCFGCGTRNVVSSEQTHDLDSLIGWNVSPHLPPF